MTLPTLILAAACIPLEGPGDRITAGDLAKAEPAFSALAPDTPLGYAPAPGVRRFFGTGELARLGVPVEAGRQLCVERPLEELGPERLLAALRNALALPDATIEVLACSRYPVPRGEIEFPRAGLGAPPPSQPRAAVLWKGYVRYAPGRRFSIWARVRVTQRLERVVAAQGLPAGKPLEAGALRVETCEGFPSRETVATSLEQVLGRAPRRSLAAGAPLRLDQLELPPDVTRGESVRVEVSAGAARLELQARAEANGRRGQTIPVRNPASGKRFAARVQDRGKVVVSQ